ncbi:MAG: UV DNA damage repair endonuclease UvsE [Chlorogloea purpurea SAG 13.99]|nr:UV DNA damage repair endonuclease UvsE [Chlorogloea purpurea SAG 13.99]
MGTHLGLICITASDAVRYRTVTRKRLLQFSPAQQAAMLRELYGDNLRRLDKALDFCAAEGIRLYRMSANLFPFADDVIGESILTELSSELAAAGEKSQDLGIRLTLHPEQFVVLSSDRPEVIENSIKILATHARMLDMMGLPRSTYALMNIHGGKGDRSWRLIETINSLPDEIRLRLTLENDEYAYGAEDILHVCRETGVAMVFDAHHHVIHDKLDSYDDPSVEKMVIEARSTWTDPDLQLVHISNGKSGFLDPQHSDYITRMPKAFWQVPWVDIEAKHKEKAIAKIYSELQNTANSIVNSQK